MFFGTCGPFYLASTAKIASSNGKLRIKILRAITLKVAAGLVGDP
jgi:hypothetical protein